MDTTRLVAAVLGVLVVCSLLAAALGTAVLDRGPSSDTGPDTEAEIGDEAGDEYERSMRAQIEANPTDVQAMLGLANVLVRKGNEQEAIDWYERALEIEPENVEVRLSFANSLTETGDQADAEIQYQRVLDLHPDNVDANFYRAELHQRWAPPRTEEAISGYRRVVELGPDSFLAERSRQELQLLGAPVGTPFGERPGTPLGGDAEGTP